MKSKIKYTKGEIEDVEIIDDFLPPPEKLVLKNQAVRVTIALTKNSVDFFKLQVSKYHVPYQRIIKNVLDDYAAYHQGNKQSKHHLSQKH